MMKIAFVTDKPYDTLETFIKAQIDHLPFEIVHYYGSVSTLKRAQDNNSRRRNLTERLFDYLSWKSNESRISALLRQDRVDLVFVQYGTLGSDLTESCRNVGIPLIVHFHGFDATIKETLKQYRTRYLRMFDYAYRIISVSHVMTSRLVAMGCPVEKIRYNPCAPRGMFCEIEPKYAKRQLIGVGRFVEKKAPHQTIRAFRKVLDNEPDVKLILAGNGPLMESCQCLVKELGMENNVELPGVISPEQLRDYLTESMVFVQHSVTAPDGDMEGTPVAVLEASGAGLPVVSTRHAGIPDIIIEGETGYLVDENDVEEMAKYILLLINDMDLIRKLGESGKENVINNFSFDKHISKLSEIIQGVFD